MTKKEWVSLVAHIISEHPEWLPDTCTALYVGVKLRLNQEIEYRATAETALAVLDINKDSIPRAQQEIVHKAIVQSKMFGGTPRAKEIESSLNIEQD